MSKPFLSDHQRAAINGAIAEAETKTCAEIVPAIARESGRYDRAEDIGGLLFALVAFSISWILFQRNAPPTDWNAKVHVTLQLPALLGILVVGFILGAFLTSRINWLRRLLATRSEMEEEVVQRAWETFGRCRIGRTAEGTGILIYISLFEHMVCVVGDDAISLKLGEKTWDEIKEMVVKGLRAGKPGDAIVAAVQRCGELLAPTFPCRPGDRNELINEVRFV